MKLKYGAVPVKDHLTELAGRISQLELQAKGNEGLWLGHNDYHLTVSHLMAKLEERIVQLEARVALIDMYKDEVIRLGQEINTLKSRGCPCLNSPNKSKNSP